MLKEQSVRKRQSVLKRHRVKETRSRRDTKKGDIEKIPTKERDTVCNRHRKKRHTAKETQR